MPFPPDGLGTGVLRLAFVKGLIVLMSEEERWDG
jgi:hypothetical protein